MDKVERARIRVILENLILVLENLASESKGPWTGTNSQALSEARELLTEWRKEK